MSRGNLNGTANDGQNAQLEIQGDCHESACADSRNDDKRTHPQTPSAREGASFWLLSTREVAYVDCHDFAMQNLAMTKDCKSLTKTRDCHAQQVALAMTVLFVILRFAKQTEVSQQHEIATPCKKHGSQWRKCGLPRGFCKSVSNDDKAQNCHKVLMRFSQ